ncbi:MAG: hypothetical protein CL565_07025 [Alphaproteobacteria bacterium]|nr:hypothetical protein [Alphaproteobacteria bacterium]
MAFRRLKSFLVYTTVIVCAGVYSAQPVNAAVENTEIADNKLKIIAKQFLQRVAPKLQANDEEFAGPVEADTTPLSIIPDGQNLLFRPKIDQLVFDIDILAVKRQGGIYLSFLDMISVLDFAIDYDDENYTAQGWFLREDWSFGLDYEERKIISRGEAYDLNEENTFIENGELYFREGFLESIFALDLDFDIGQQYVLIDSEYPLPRIAAENRKNRRFGYGGRNRAELPRKDIPYKNFDINTLDLSLSASKRRTRNSEEAFNRTFSTAVAEGDVLQHKAYTQVNFSNEYGLNNVVARLSRQSEEPKLLGPLKAREYVLGDTDTVDLPLTGDSGQEVGVSVTNNPLEIDDFSTTDISGDAIPGYDVELYRNGILIDVITVDESGRYLFNDIELFAGDNIFELFFYGPQGQIRFDTVNVPVTEALLSTQQNTYTFSSTLAEQQLYNARENNDEDVGTPHVAGRYNFFLGDVLAYAGFRARQTQGESQAFLAGGFNKIIGSTIIDGDLGVDKDGETAAELGARRNIFGWDTIVNGRVNTEEYNPDGSENPSVMQLSANVRRNFIPPIGDRATVQAAGLYSKTADGGTVTRANLAVANNFGRVNVSNNLVYQNNDVTNFNTNLDDSDFDAERVNNTLSVRGNFGKWLARGGFNYEVVPDHELQRVFSQITYRPTLNFSGDLFVDHEPSLDLTTARLNLNYLNENFRLTPYVEKDNQGGYGVGVALNTSIVDDPPDEEPLFTSDRLIGRGYASGFVFFDKNGNMIFDGDDEPLPEVVVESINIKRRALTDEKGYALVKGLNEGKATDIHVDEETLPDAFMFSANEGYSIFPRAGSMPEINFPIQLAGEIDGTVSIYRNYNDDAPRAARLVTVQLVPLEGRQRKVITTETAGDGFFVFPKVPPGRYAMLVAPDDQKDLEVGQAAVQYIDVGYDGPVFYGKNIALYDDAPELNIKSKKIYRIAEGGQNIASTPFYIVRVNEEDDSQLLSLLRRLQIKRLPDRLRAQMIPIKFEDTLDSEIIYAYFIGRGRLEESVEFCREASNWTISCEIEPVELETVQSASAEN